MSLDLREKKLEETGENSIVRNFKDITVHQIGPPIAVTMKSLRMG